MSLQQTKQHAAAKRLRPIEEDLLHFDRTRFEVFDSFDAADQSEREYWRARSPEDRMKALEHIRQRAWGYDESNRPKLRGTVGVLECRQG